MLKCAHCDKVYKYESERKRHQKSHFPQFECIVCAKKFSFLSALRRHQKQHERTGSVQCGQCGGHFRDETLLKRHIQYAHRGTYSCPECNTTFSSDLALRTHSKIHNPESERKFRCSYEGCKKAFNFPHHLKHHELTHTNAKQHYCNICGKGFIQSHHLKTHLKAHSPQNLLFCTRPECSKKFATKHAWKKHIAAHGKVLKPSLTEIRFDSGISSDSNSASEIRENVEDTLLCATCGKLILRRQYIKHKLKCNPSFKENCESANLEDVLFNYNSGIEPIDTSDCSHELAQKTRTINLKIDGVGISDSSENLIKAPEVEDAPTPSVKEEIRTDTSSGVSHPCAGCACVGDRLASGFPGSNNNLEFTLKTQLVCTSNNMPAIEYRKDGIVKIREIFDVDIVTIKDVQKETKSRAKNEVNDLKYVPFNSCKAVLGNCIVSEDGSIGEECLCARMIVDEQQMSAQEIDELTPSPYASWMS
ncbi:uncharacterized protein isoform X2 [Choristoneura fumiferana]|uniref:uncharacterized protein isoform X2 n=1 Tax=Choristoneura fumiferana TaxID=7141 RepID=UPI003D1570A5